MKKILLAVIISSALTVGFVNADEVAVSEEEIVIETIVTENSEEVTVVESTSQSEESVEVASTTEEVIEIPTQEETPISTININLEVYSATTTLFRSQLKVEACSYNGIVPSSLNALCAVRQSGLSAVWSNFGDDYFLDSINGATNDFTSNMYWLWFAGNDLGSVAMNKYLLSENERIIVTIGRTPMRVVVATTTPIVGATTTISILEFGFDSSFSPVYLPSASSTIIIDGVETELDSSGTYNLIPTSTSTIIVEARKNGFLNAESIAMFPYIVDVATSTVEERETTQSPTSGGGSVQRQFDIAKAIQFLISKQNENGSFENELYSDWAGIALASVGQNIPLQKLNNYLQLNPITGDSVTDYERRAISLMALEVSPYNGTKINYIQKIIDKFDGVQIGDSGLVNDDIFGIIVLREAGIGADEDVIKKVTDFVISKQRTDGSWEGSVDMTGAGLQALAVIPNSPEVILAKEKAKEFLLRSQQDNGGFGSSFATSWAVQGLIAVGENPRNIFRSGNNFLNYFANIQESDGGVESMNSPSSTRLWATSYAIPAVAEMSWSAIAKDFAKPVIVSTSGGGGGGVVDSNISSTTLLVASTTSIEISTSKATTSSIQVNPQESENNTATINSVDDDSPRSDRIAVQEQNSSVITETASNGNLESNENIELIANVGASEKSTSGNVYFAIGAFGLLILSVVGITWRRFVRLI